MARGFLDEQVSDGSVGRRGSAFADRHVEIAAIMLKGKTAKGRFFDVGTKEAFIPYSQMSVTTRENIAQLAVGSHVLLSVTEWFANEKGLI